MLVLKNIFYKNSKYTSTNIFINKEYLKNYINGYDSVMNFDEIDFEILDTLSDSIKVYNILDILDFISKIFGVVENNKFYMCIIVSNDLWKLLDYIDSPKLYRPKDNILKPYTKMRMTKSNSTYTIFNSDKNNIILYTIHNDIVPIDKNLIFWKIFTNSAISILDIYEIVFDEIQINYNDYVFIKTQDNNLYKLSINKDVIRFLVKLKTLKG